VLEALVEVA
jgi:hypothetical protein